MAFSSTSLPYPALTMLSLAVVVSEGSWELGKRKPVQGKSGEDYVTVAERNNLRKWQELLSYHCWKHLLSCSLRRVGMPAVEVACSLMVLLESLLRLEIKITVTRDTRSLLQVARKLYPFHFIYGTRLFDSCFLHLQPRPLQCTKGNQKL